MQLLARPSSAGWFAIGDLTAPNATARLTTSRKDRAIKTGATGTMSSLSHHSELHKRLIHFVVWIATTSDTEDKIQTQITEVRSRISSKAKDDGLTVRSTPNSGSYAKRTGLRRHLYGNTPIEGQDVDAPFVVSPSDCNGEELTSLIDRFFGYADASYSDTEKKPTKSSVKLMFKASRLNYDLVPMLATEDNRRQVLLRANGERIETSVQGHIEFIRSRTRSSRADAGRVAFNEMVRLMKWWRSVCEQNATFEVPSIVIDLLCAKAFDERSVQYTYQETLAEWFGYLHHMVKTRGAVYFSDYQTWHDGPESAATWSVIDPVNSDNNIVANWAGWQVSQFAEWLSEARDHCNRAIARDRRGDERGYLDSLNAVFGNHFENNSGKED